jgi:predicted O-linked N-acetylglucosamine transferase (SPINDLY family)
MFFGQVSLVFFCYFNIMNFFLIGTPMISLPVETLASRVGASLLHTLGCPELVAESYDD